ncbi:hypothetical protein B5P41_34200, partial [Bacillus sp. SRB_28]
IDRKQQEKDANRVEQQRQQQGQPHARLAKNHRVDKRVAAPLRKPVFIAPEQIGGGRGERQRQPGPPRPARFPAFDQRHDKQTQGDDGKHHPAHV